MKLITFQKFCLKLNSHDKWSQKKNEEMCLGNIENVTYGSDVHCWMENVRVLMVRHSSVTRIFMLLTLLLHVALDVKLLVTYLKILLRKDHEMIHEEAEKKIVKLFGQTCLEIHGKLPVLVLSV